MTYLYIYGECAGVYNDGCIAGGACLEPGVCSRPQRGEGVTEGP